jgi:hypothetical protein
MGGLQSKKVFVMLLQPVETIAEFLHTSSGPIARKYVSEVLSPLDADHVLLFYRDQYPDFHDRVFWYLSDRVCEKTSRHS